MDWIFLFTVVRLMSIMEQDTEDNLHNQADVASQPKVTFGHLISPFFNSASLLLYQLGCGGSNSQRFNPMQPGGGGGFKILHLFTRIWITGNNLPLSWAKLIMACNKSSLLIWLNHWHHHQFRLVRELIQMNSLVLWQLRCLDLLKIKLNIVRLV